MSAKIVHPCGKTKIITIISFFLPPEPTRPPASRSRRSTSLLKEVILEESLSQLESPLPKRSTASRIPEQLVPSVVSSPAANTRSRRSSIQSMPEELEDILNAPLATRAAAAAAVVSKKSFHDEARSRRATSVDSTVATAGSGKRLTRSVLAKVGSGSSVLDEVIPEETVGKKVTGTTTTTARRKRATSVDVDAMSEKAAKEAKARATGRPKRGRKASETRDYQFSPPQTAGEAPGASGEGR